MATAEGAKALADSGADAIKIGIGPGSICTTRVVAGVGVPNSRLFWRLPKNVTDREYRQLLMGVLASWGFGEGHRSRADCASWLFAGWYRQLRGLILYQGRSYKAYRGMGSLGAMARGSADRISRRGN